MKTESKPAFPVEVSVDENGNDFIVDVSARTSDYICVDCGVKFLTEKQKENGGVSTFHFGKCGLCGEEKIITHIRKYNYLYIYANVPRVFVGRIINTKLY